MSGTDTAAMVPDVYDVVIDGYGYVTSRAVDPNLPFRTQQQNLSYTPTFLERTNVSGNYGDDSQAFFFTAAQHDWSLGEQQRFFRSGDAGSVRRYWTGTAVDVHTPGLASLQQASGTISFGVTQSVVASDPASAVTFVGSATTLYSVTYAVIGSSNVHGLGATPSTCAHDGKNAYLSVTGGVGVRTGDATGALTTFSATTSDLLCFHNNSLYGITNGTGILRVYDTAGTATTLFQWKRPDGTAAPQSFVGMVPFGGKLMIVGLNQLWMYDGVAVSLVAQFPTNFFAGSMAVVSGVLAIGGMEYRTSAPTRPVVYVYSGGSIQKLWSSTGTLTNARARTAAFDGGIVWNDDATSRIMYWDPGTGAISGLFTYSGTSPQLSANYSQLLVTGGANSGSDAAYYSAQTVATSGTLTSSLFDFDNSLTKLMRGIKVDFSAATDGNGGSVDIAYQVDSTDGSYTSLQTGAVSGTEYGLTGVTGHSISVKVTLNKGTSTSGPTLKRVYVRGAPVMQPYRLNSFIFDLGGDPGQLAPVRRRDDSDHTLTGEEMRANLAAAITSTTPISVTDRTGTYTAVLEPAGCEFDLTRPGQWYAQIRVREV